MHGPRPLIPVALAAGALTACQVPPAPDAEPRLVGWAYLPADTFVAGPTSGQFIDPPGDRRPPFENAQPIQGFSALLPAGTGVFLAMPDNGFGTKENSADFLLRVYAIRPDFRTRAGGSGTVAITPAFLLRDPDRRVPFPIVADRERYPGSSIPVPTAVRVARLLTGADFDIESFRRVPDGTFYFGDEFGPFLLHTDSTGVLLEPPIPLPGVRSPQHPTLGGAAPTLPRSSGFEGTALTPDGTALLPLLEQPRIGAAPYLDLYRFDLATGRYAHQDPDSAVARIRLSADAVGVTELTWWRDAHFLIIERDAGQGPAARLKRIARVRLGDTMPDGALRATPIVDLLRIADPDDLGGGGDGWFALRYETTEAVAVVDDSTIVVLNDNNYPFGRAGRSPDGGPDGTEILLIRIPGHWPGP